MPRELKHCVNPWITTAEQSSRIAESNKDASLMSGAMVIVDGIEASQPSRTSSRDLDTSKGQNLGLPERAFSAAGAAFLSAILVNPLDVAKTRLQAQAAGVPYSHPLSNLTTRMTFFGHMVCVTTLNCGRPGTRRMIECLGRPGADGRDFQSGYVRIPGATAEPQTRTGSSGRGPGPPDADRVLRTVEISAEE